MTSISNIEVAAEAASASSAKPRRQRRMARERSEADARHAAPGAAPATKIGAVIALLECPEGATIAELTAATGWQAHTVRAALTGLRKKGRAIEKDKRGAETCYRIAGAN
jgi:hypothetical protein